MLDYIVMLHFISGIQCYLQCHPTFEVNIFHWSYSQPLMLAEMNVADIYVRTTRSLLQITYFCWCRENIQHSMLDHPYFNQISMDSYKIEIFMTFML